MPDKFKCDKCEKTFNEPVERRHEEVVSDLRGRITEVTIADSGMTASGAWFTPGKRKWATKHCPYCDGQGLYEWFEGYVNWDSGGDFF